MPKTLIVATIFNEEENIQRSLGSLLKQTHKNIEIVVFDNNSTDNSIKVIESFCDNRITIIPSAQNEGVWGNYLKMLYYISRKDDYEYFLFADIDDFYSEIYLETLITLLEENPHSLLALPTVRIKWFDAVRNLIKEGVFSYNLPLFGRSKFRNAFEMINKPALQYSMAIRGLMRKEAVPIFHQPHHSNFSVEEFIAVVALYLGGIVSTDAILHTKYQNILPLKFIGDHVFDKIYKVDTWRKKWQILLDDVKILRKINPLSFLARLEIISLLFYRLFLRGLQFRLIDPIINSNNFVSIFLLRIARSLKLLIRKVFP